MLEPVLSCHTVLGLVARDRNRLADAAGHFERSGAIAEQLGLGEAAIVANTNLGDLALPNGDLEEAERRLERTLAWNHEHGLGEGRRHLRAARARQCRAYRRAALDKAEERFSQALRLSERAGFRQNAALALVGLAAVSAERGRHVETSLLLGRASELVVVTGAALTGSDAELYDRASASVAAVGEQS